MFNINNQLPSGGSNIEIKIGEVISVEDPYRMFRAQVRVFGVTDDKRGIPDSDLPWYPCMFPVSSASLAGAGASSGLEPGSKVYVMFLDVPMRQNAVILGSSYPGPSSPSHISPLAKGLKEKGPKLPIGENGNEIDLGVFGNIGITDIFNNIFKQFETILQSAQIFKFLNLFKKK